MSNLDDRYRVRCSAPERVYWISSDRCHSRVFVRDDNTVTFPRTSDQFRRVVYRRYELTGPTSTKGEILDLSTLPPARPGTSFNHQHQLMRRDQPDCNTVVARYFEAPQPNLPKDLQFLSPDTQREVHKSYRTFYKLNADELQHREDLIVDVLVYLIAPRMLCSRYDTERRFPDDVEELDALIGCYTWILLNDVVDWKKLDLSDETKEFLVADVRIAIEPFIHGGDYGVSAEVCGQMARERLYAAGILPLRSQQDSLHRQVADLGIQ